MAARPNDYEGKEFAVRRCEDTFAVGDAVGMCRFDTKLFNSPTLPGCEEFSKHLEALTGLSWSAGELLESGRNITGLERLINARLGLGAEDDTLPARWFDEANESGPFAGEKIDRDSFEALKARFYSISGLDNDGLPLPEWRKKLLESTTGFAVSVTLPPSLGARELIIGSVPDGLPGLRRSIIELVPGEAAALEDASLSFAVNGELVISSERNVEIKSGDKIVLVPAISGG